MGIRLALADLVGGRENDLVVIDPPEVTLGRDPGIGICVNDDGISRRHGIFGVIADNWFYKDLESTNGSYINGEELIPNLWLPVREGDIVQLSDVCLKVHEIVEGKEAPRARENTLLVFNNDSLLGQFPIPNHGKALTIGGEGADLMLHGLSSQLPTLVVEKRSTKLCAYSIDEQQDVLHNNSKLTEMIFLEDRDVIRVGSYIVILDNVKDSKSILKRDEFVAQLEQQAESKELSEEQAKIRQLYSEDVSDGELQSQLVTSNVSRLIPTFGRIVESAEPELPVANGSSSVIQVAETKKGMRIDLDDDVDSTEFHGWSREIADIALVLVGITLLFVIIGAALFLLMK